MSKIEDKFKENKNILIGKTYCPFCTRAKRILEKKNIELQTFLLLTLQLTSRN
ncbi:hypothetical protein H312_02053 [Anncaliia algerae PRA339]|uniref:Glutaredoxin domain-containing protein n=1 Tax=Anncaliia algerae PRA339 TaxID=1288291 RepID=A0A059F0R9_9MICR|nr:hypothetical protein H312_02053 [Anncaliia algerae PRA339]